MTDGVLLTHNFILSYSTFFCRKIQNSLFFFFFFMPSRSFFYIQTKISAIFPVNACNPFFQPSIKTNKISCLLMTFSDQHKRAMKNSLIITFLKQFDISYGLLLIELGEIKHKGEKDIEAKREAGTTVMWSPGWSKRHGKQLWRKKWILPENFEGLIWLNGVLLLHHRIQTTTTGHFQSTPRI